MNCELKVEFAKLSSWRKRKQYTQGLLKGWWGLDMTSTNATHSLSMVKANEARPAASTWSGETLGFGRHVRVSLPEGATQLH